MPKKLSDLVVLFVDQGLFVEIACKLAQTYKKVYYFCPGWTSAFPKMNNTMIGTGMPGLEVVSSIFGDHFDEIDLFIFPDCNFGPEQVHLRSLNKPVWGAGMGEDLELDRVLMKKIMRERGLPVGAYKTVKGMAALRDHLKANKNQHVKVSRFRGTFETFKSEEYKLVEPKLDEVEHGLGALKHDIELVVEDDLSNRFEVGEDMYCIDGQYPSKILVGPEIKDRGLVAIFKERKQLPESMLRFDRAIAPVLKKYGWRGFLSTEIRVGKDGIGYMIDLCFDAETEVLTDSGWKLFKDCAPSDKLATLNTTHRTIEYQLPSGYTSQPYRGKMVRITNPKGSIDCLVTPDHDVLRTDRNKRTLFKEKASRLSDKGFIPRTGLWAAGHSDQVFVLPEYHHEWDFVGQYGHRICRRVKHEPDLPIPMADWAAFMGWFLSEGSTYTVGGCRKSNRSTVTISQTKCRDELECVLKRLPFKYSSNRAGFRICSTQLANYLKRFGLCDKKFVPDYIKNAQGPIIRVFLDNFRLGDGSNRGRRKLYFTTSKSLADDIQELIFKSGSVANIHHRPNKGTTMSIGHKHYIRKHDSYILEECSVFTDFWFETKKRKSRYITDVDYDGTVFCATVPNGTLYVRRKGKPFWSGNCSRAASPPSELYTEFYTNLADIIWQGANGVLVDPVPVAKFGAEALIHSSWADKNWQPLDIPDELKRYVKLRNAMKMQGRYYVAPQSVGLPEIGAVVGWGNTMEEAVAMVKKIADQVKGYYVEVTVDCFDKAEEEIAQAEKFGINIFS